jgi:hypothetical protein
MRVDREDTDLRIRDPGPAHGLVPAANRALHQAGFDLRDGVDEADVRGHMDDPDLRRRQHHRHLLGAGQVCQQFRVAGKHVAARVECLLVERGGADRVDVPGDGELAGDSDVVVRGVAGDGRHLPPR